MATPIQTNGIIIKEYNFDEADKIFVIFTADKGKISCLAKGVRKSRSKMRGFLQLFTYSKLHLHKGKSMYTIIGGEAINSFPQVKNDLLLFGYANYITEVLENILPTEEKNNAIFSNTVSLFHLMGSIPISQLSSYYMLRLIKYAGFLPELSRCVLCGERIDANALFHNIEGGCVCVQCGKEFDNKAYIPLYIIRIMEQLLSMDINMLGRLKVKDRDQFFIEDLLCEYLKSVLERPINSIKFIREIRDA
ncbi:DNA repair protein RecO [Desulfitibacter alkalitolerans]|uniref:DNA repair protein RecO n=1 Tax=Desulfitibacter alkalitolerans TaxID=264641 RepID=UPI000484EC7D|nr:DNA repair protein RecO [Desulfitibacter alkalitolerans]